MAPDKYGSFCELESREKGGYRIRTRSAGPILILALHGGGIEPGTSELAKAIAAANHSLYLFEGCKKNHNTDLHITSTKFREPQCEEMLARAYGVLAVHGARNDAPVVFIGGLAANDITRISTSLISSKFDVRESDNTNLQGREPTNCCNRGQNLAGVQLEISAGLRCELFQGLTTRTERQHTTERFDRFVEAIRQVLG